MKNQLKSMIILAQLTNFSSIHQTCLIKLELLQLSHRMNLLHKFKPKMDMLRSMIDSNLNSTKIESNSMKKSREFKKKKNLITNWISWPHPLMKTFNYDNII